MLNTEAKVGGVTVIGLILLAYMIVHLGDGIFGNRGYPVEVVFANVGGLKQGNAVRYAGVDVGLIKAVAIAPDGVRTTLLINPEVKIPAGSKFLIGADGIMGEKYIEIVPAANSTEFLAAGSVVRGEEPQKMDHLLASADKMLVEMKTLMQSFNAIVGDEKFKTALRDTAVNAQDISANLNAMSATLARMAANNEGDIHTLVGNLRDMSADLRTVAGRVDSMMAGLDNHGQTSRDLRETIANLRSTSARVEKMAAVLEGVTTDPQMVKTIKETVQNAHDASAKANRMLGKLDGFNVKPSVDLLYKSSAATKFRGDADLRVGVSAHQFALFGINGIGDNPMTELQVGRTDGRFSSRAGIVDSKVGIGFDSKWGDHFQLSVDVYDPSAAKVKLRTEYQLSGDTFLVGENDAINKDSQYGTYFGLKKTF